MTREGERVCQTLYVVYANQVSPGSKNSLCSRTESLGRVCAQDRWLNIQDILTRSSNQWGI